jgi:hypothetical protein
VATFSHVCFSCQETSFQNEVSVGTSVGQFSLFQRTNWCVRVGYMKHWSGLGKPNNCSWPMLGGPGNEVFWEKGNWEPRANWRLTGSWPLVLVWGYLELDWNWVWFSDPELVFFLRNGNSTRFPVPFMSRTKNQNHSKLIFKTGDSSWK